MTQKTEKTLHGVTMGIGVFLATVLVALVASELRKNPKGWIDLLPTAWISDKDREVLKDPAAANKAAYEDMSREAWQNSQGR